MEDGPVIQVVWFKRDLRVRDHPPLAGAAQAGPVLPLYVYEPAVLHAPDCAARHTAFVNDCLRELGDALAALGSSLIVRHGDMPQVLADLRGEIGPFVLWSHEETGNAVTFARDRSVAAWCRETGTPWHELPQHGVFRGLRDRDHWAGRWDARMSAPMAATPRHLTPPAVRVSSIGLMDPAALDQGDPDAPQRQRGGRLDGEALLASFLDGRGVGYRTAMSSPLSAADGCSRLSAHFAYGSVSIRETAQAVWRRRTELQALPAEVRPRGMLSALRSFESRLHWHCHFMQKLESEPDIEFTNMHRGFDGLRETAFDPARFTAWCRGETGLPMVDACMRMLAATGWINFRMRAMLTSFASYQLWLHWREPALHLARLFTDYEPGIHYPQIQMQSGTTGINTIRMYNPIKQARDQDPGGQFVRQWIPALTRVPDAFVFEPWTMPSTVQREAGCVLGCDYPAPIVDNAAAMRVARERVWSLKARREVRETAQAVYEKHGSRHPGREGTPRRSRAKRTASAQMTFAFDDPVE